MTEWIVDADRPTRSMQRMKTGEVTRCVDCRRCERVGEMAYCHLFRQYVLPRGFCWAGEPR